MTRIYLDNASTTPVAPDVVEELLPFLNSHFGNASSIHAFGQQTRNALELAREELAKEIGAKPSEVFFTSSGTEADNLALKGVVLAAFGKPIQIITSTLEHKAVLESAEWLQKKFNITVKFIAHDAQGRLDLDDLKKKIRPDHLNLISMMHANNELGNINPIKEIAAIAKSYNAIVHTDAVQSAGKLCLNVDELGVDLMAISGHKFYAPKGIGAIYVRTGVQVDALLHGGTHERNRRAGTENVAFAVALVKALKFAHANLQQDFLHVASLQKAFLEMLAELNVPFSLNGDEVNKLPHILNLSFPIPTKQKLVGDVLLLALDAAGIAVSSGSACTSGTAKPSHVLLALGKSEHEARASVRVSFSKFNTEEEVRDAAGRFADVLKRLL
ncbi:MAG: cysteine desulfurase family protein [Chloroherpetonaceae bacterium]